MADLTAGPSDDPADDSAGVMRTLMRQYHAEINAHVEGTVADLHARWQAAQAALGEKIKQLEAQMQAAQDAGDDITASWLAQAGQLTALQAAVEGDVGAFAEGAQQIVGQGQLAAADLGAQAAQDALAASVPPGMSYVFGVPPGDVTQQLAGALQAGSPLAQLFGQMGSDAAQQAQQALFTSVAVGESAAQMAQRLEYATNMSAQRAEVIARTELLRSWRGAQMENFRANSDVVQAWQWSCEQSPRSCGACIALDGSVHPLDEQLEGHPCCRCSALPLTVPWSQIFGDAGIAPAGMPASLLGADAVGGVLAGRETGVQWFARQDFALQNTILGPAKAEAYRVGDLTLKDLIGYSHSAQWGTSLREKSLRELGFDAQRYLTLARAHGMARLASEAEIATADAERTAARAAFAQAQAARAAAAAEEAAQRAARKAAADAWYAQIKASIARGRPSATARVLDYTDPGAMWGIHRDEAIAVAEGRAEFLSAKPVSEAASAVDDTGAAFSPLSAPGGRGEVAAYELTADDRAFVQDLRSQIPAEGITSADDAIALGRQLSERINGQLANLQGFANEEALIYRMAPDLTDAQRAWAMGEKAAVDAHGGVSWTRAAQQLQSAYQAQVRAYLAELRPLGGVEVKVAEGADAVVAARLASATELMPSDWLMASNDLGELSLVKASERSSSGWFEGRLAGNGTVAVRYVKTSDAADLESTVLHEMTHRMEQAVPVLSDIQTQFYEARTAGEDFVALTNGIKQQTKLDDWLDQYLGRQPMEVLRPTITQFDGTERSAVKSYELLTMGSEMALAPGASATTFALHSDTEYESFVLGTLMGVKATASDIAVADGAATDVADTALGVSSEAVTGEMAFSANNAARQFGDPLSNIFQQPLSETDIAQLVGASEQDAVHVEEVDEGVVQVNVTTAGHEAAFEFSRDENGRLIATGDVQTEEGARGFASGRDLLTAMGHMNNLGVDELVVDASRAGTSNGYETWARLGFTGDIPANVLTAAQERFGPDVTRVEQLMQLPGGPRWWRANGDTWEASFDFTPGSYSRSVFDPLADRLGVTLTDDVPPVAAPSTTIEAGGVASITAESRDALAALYDGLSERAMEKAARQAGKTIWADASAMAALNAAPTGTRVLKGFQDIGLHGAELQATYQSVMSNLLAKDLGNVLVSGQAKTDQQVALLEAARQELGWGGAAQAVPPAYQAAMPTLRQFVRQFVMQVGKAAK